ncbi:MAG: hypothetical protein LBT42_06415 [Tannerella sp.]|jgi:Leucine-rich repeat (LRR) protein|nr:hypothetical protein [Tannerella sp.]
MKKVILFSFVCSLTLLFTDCTDKDSKVFVELPDANFKSYILENFDANKDGKLSLQEAKLIKEIDCSGREIEVLDGIEKFENLESLDCKDNQLEELELRYNKKLNKLVCTGNKTPTTIYIGMKSPLRNINVQKPANNAPPSAANMSLKPLDESKCTYDHENTNIYLSFDD